MNKKPAIIAALIITLMIGLSMLGIGANAWINTQTAAAASAQVAANTTSTAAVSAEQQQIQDLQALVQQYQAREAQYQAELKQAAQEVSQANQLASTSSNQTQNYQLILNQLQQAGLIQIGTNGQITINNANRRSSTSRTGG